MTDISQGCMKIDRRGFVRLSVAGAAATMLGTSAGVAMANEPATTYMPGSYVGTAMGKRGPVVVKTTFDETSISAIEIVEHRETRYISDMALDRLPRAIVEHQSLNIDSITGATFTSYAIKAAVADCVEQAGGDVKALESAACPEKRAETVEMNADVVVVGGGASGMAAAVAAAQGGARSVVVMEKTSNIGGNALVSGGYIHYIYAPQELRQEMTEGLAAYFDGLLDKAAEEGVDAGFIESLRKDYENYYADGKTTVYDSTDLVALDYHFTNGGALEGWLDYTPHVAELDDWLTELGLGWKKLTGIVGFPWPRWSSSTDGHCGEGFFNTFTRAVETEGLPVTIVPLTTANELIMDGKRVAGVVGLCDDGTTYRVKASRGVILATGGYSGSPEMLKKYNTFWEWDEDTVIPTTNAYGHTGDGIVMATAVGAQVANMERPMVFPYADLKDWSTETIVGDSADCPLVNIEGKRFVNETLDRYTMSAAMMQQPNNEAIIISDSVNCQITNGVTFFGADEEYLLQNGQLFRADTIADLAEQLGMDPSVLEETVENYNRAVEMGEDAEFGRTVFKETSPIKEPPFYASPRTWAAHITLGGIVVDDAFRALDAAGEPIEGLYCVGELVAYRSGVHSMCTGLHAARVLCGA